MIRLTLTLNLTLYAMLAVHVTISLAAIIAI